MQLADTRVHRAVIKMLASAQLEHRNIMLSGPTGIGLSYSASTFVEAEPQSRILFRARPGTAEEVAGALSACLAPIPTLFPDLYDAPSGSKREKLRKAAEELGRRSRVEDRLLIVVDQAEALGTALQLERFLQALVDDLATLNVALAVIGGEKLGVPRSNFDKPRSDSLITDWVVHRFDLFDFTVDQLTNEDVMKMAHSKGASAAVAGLIARLVDTEVLVPSYHQIERAVRRLEMHSSPADLKLGQARRLLLA